MIKKPGDYKSHEVVGADEAIEALASMIVLCVIMQSPRSIWPVIAIYSPIIDRSLRT